MRKRTILLVMLLIALFTPVPINASECWYTNDQTIWQLPIEMIFWYIYWTMPQLWNEMMSHNFSSQAEAFEWLVGHYCAFAG